MCKKMFAKLRQVWIAIDCCSSNARKTRRLEFSCFLRRNKKSTSYRHFSVDIGLVFFLFLIFSCVIIVYENCCFFLQILSIFPLLFITYMGLNLHETFISLRLYARSFVLCVLYEIRFFFSKIKSTTFSTGKV